MNIIHVLTPIIALVSLGASLGHCAPPSPALGLKPDAIPSLLPKESQWKLIWHDEFDGTELDRTKWDYRTHLMGQRHHTFSEGGAVPDGKGCLRLELQEKDGQYFSPHLQTGSNFMDRPGGAYGKSKLHWAIGKLQKPKFLHKYGYYECRAKLPTQEGWWVAFWLQSPIIGSTLDPEFSGVEVDIMENFKRNGIINHNNFWNGYGEDKQKASSGDRQLKETPDGFHVFGLKWTPEAYIYYVDGEETWRVTSPVSQREQFILISTECFGYRKGETPREDLTHAVLPDAFIVDYVRVYDEVPK